MKVLLLNVVGMNVIFFPIIYFFLKWTYEVNIENYFCSIIFFFLDLNRKALDISKQSNKN
jgi:hypothetical protein